MKRLHWSIASAALAVTSAMVGGVWDISWHRSIGRDAFLTPPHLLIYACGVLGGLTAAALIFAATFARAPDAATVRVWGFRGPLGAFVMAWGGVAMLTSAPFDNWWHNTYGLDVKILSPPHTVLALGMLGVELGALVLALGRMNRAAAEEARATRAAFLYLGAMIVVCTMVMLMEETIDVLMHSARFYWVVALAVPVTLAGLRRASGHPFAATLTTAIYTILNLLFIWILPLFPAEPKLGPVYQPVTHLIPPLFPVLLIAPALALDLLWSRPQRRGDWTGALLAGMLFVGVLVVVQWPFARFLMSAASRNWFFGTHYFDYGTPSFSYEFRRIFHRDASRARLWAGLALAFGCAVLSTRIGLAWGSWMTRIRR
jgi:hypothetical protein